MELYGQSISSVIMYIIKVSTAISQQYIFLQSRVMYMCNCASDVHNWLAVWHAPWSAHLVPSIKLPACTCEMWAGSLTAWLSGLILTSLFSVASLLVSQTGRLLSLGTQIVRSPAASTNWWAGVGLATHLSDERGTN